MLVCDANQREAQDCILREALRCNVKRLPAANMKRSLRECGYDILLRFAPTQRDLQIPRRLYPTARRGTRHIGFVFVNTNIVSRDTFLKLVDEFGNKVRYIIRAVADNKAFRITIEELKNKPKYTKEQIKEAVNAETYDRARAILD